MTGVQTCALPIFQILKDSYADLIPAGRPDYSPFRPGMSTTVDIQTERRNDVLSVPIQAVTTRQDTTGKYVRKKVEIDEETGEVAEETTRKTSTETYKEYVFVFNSGHVKLREVKSGIQDNTHIEIISGLEAGDEVVIAPFSAISKRLKNNDKVEKVDKEKLYEEK